MVFPLSPENYHIGIFNIMQCIVGITRGITKALYISKQHDNDIAIIKAIGNCHIQCCLEKTT